jgi:hypothetical protein
MQHLLKSPPRAARTDIFPAELLKEFFLAVYDSKAALDAGF